jgi:hypothetical protein
MIPAVDGVCEECGFDYEGVPDADVGDKLRSFGRRYRAPLTRGLPGESLDALLRAHPTPGVWSALEYACHVRDVFAIMLGRVERAVAEDKPTLESMGGELLVESEQYNEQDPLAVVDDLAANAEAAAAVFEALDDAASARTVIFPYPEPTERDVHWMIRHTIHEGHHHLLDVGRALRTARGR